METFTQLTMRSLRREFRPFKKQILSARREIDYYNNNMNVPVFCNSKRAREEGTTMETPKNLTRMKKKPILKIIPAKLLTLLRKWHHRTQFHNAIQKEMETIFGEEWERIYAALPALKSF